jgi:hypothetical protein
LAANTIGHNNIATGHQALTANTTGNDNTIGWHAVSNTTAQQCVAGTMQANTTGNNNVATDPSDNTTGSDNLATGSTPWR